MAREAGGVLGMMERARGKFGGKMCSMVAVVVGMGVKNQTRDG